jgi:hypothetical protein
MPGLIDDLRVDMEQATPFPEGRIGKDGTIVMCGVMTITAHNKPRYNCGGILGELVHEEQEETAFRLADNFGFQADESEQNHYPPKGIFRVTGRSFKRTDKHHRGQVPESGFGLDEWGRLYDEDNPRPWYWEWEQNYRQQYFKANADVGNFALPIRVLCPKCKRINSIAVALIESA